MFRWRSGVLFLALTACGPAPLEPRDPAPGAVHFTVETFNVEFQHSDDGATVNAVGDSDADVVVLQEVTPEWESVLEARYADQYPNRLYHSKGGTGGLAVLSRFPIDDAGFHPGPNGWHPAWHVILDTPMGPVQLLNVHLRSIFSGRSSAVTAYLKVGGDHLEEMEQFSGECAVGVPTLVAGDFNEEPNGSAVRYLEHKGYRNALPLFHPGQPTWRQPPAWQFEQVLDHVLFDRSFEPLDAWVRNEGNSDHLPVLAHVQQVQR